MNKDKRNILILFLILMVVVASSYLLFVSGTTNKLKGSINKMDAKVNDSANSSYYPVITMVINSSGEKLVNEDVALTINAESNYKIDKLSYSFDLENWQDIMLEVPYKTSISTKLIFNKTRNSKVYIRVENEKGYKSYAYETSVNIDKEKPVLNVLKLKSNTIINASDNTGLKAIQYSNDNMNWETMEVSEKKVSLTKNNFEYKYIRVVDIAGNISFVKEVK